MAVSLVKDPVMIEAQLRIKALGDRFGFSTPDRIRGRGWKREKYLVLRPGNCSNNQGRCDCLSGTTRPIVDVAVVRWH